MMITGHAQIEPTMEGSVLTSKLQDINLSDSLNFRYGINLSLFTSESQAASRSADVASSTVILPDSAFLPPTQLLNCFKNKPHTYKNSV